MLLSCSMTLRLWWWLIEIHHYVILSELSLHVCGLTNFHPSSYHRKQGREYSTQDMRRSIRSSSSCLLFYNHSHGRSRSRVNVLLLRALSTTAPSSTHKPAEQLVIKQYNVKRGKEEETLFYADTTKTATSSATENNSSSSAVGMDTSSYHKVLPVFTSEVRMWTINRSSKSDQSEWWEMMDTCPVPFYCCDKPNRIWQEIQWEISSEPCFHVVIQSLYRKDMLGTYIPHVTRLLNDDFILTYIHTHTYCYCSAHYQLRQATNDCFPCELRHWCPLYTIIALCHGSRCGIRALGCCTELGDQGWYRPSRGHCLCQVRTYIPLEWGCI